MRLQGEGHYYTDKRGYHAWRIRIDGRDITRKSKTLKALKPKVAALLKEIEQAGDTPVDTSDPTVAVFLNQWLDETVKPSRAGKTYRFYKQMVNLYIVPTIGAKKLKKLTFDDCQFAVNSVVRKGLSAQTGLHTRSVLRRALNVAVTRKLIVVNPCLGTEPPKLELITRRALKPDGISNLTDEAFTRRQLKTRDESVAVHKLGPVVVFLVSTGLSISELLGLKDTDFDAEGFQVSRKLERETGEAWSLKPLKALSRNRRVPLSDLSKKALEEWRKIQAEDVKRAGQYWRNHGFTFTAGNGEPLFDRNVQRSLTAILTAAKLGHYGLHDLRRTFGTTLANDGVPIHVTASLMGHSDIKTTLKHYNNAFDEDKSKAVNSISKFTNQLF